MITMDPSLRTFTFHERAPGRFTLCGELDMASVAQLDELDDVHGPLLLDLRGVSFIDASGVRGLVRLYERCPHHSCTFLIERCSPQAERVLRIVGLYEIFTEDSGAHAAIPRPPVLEEELAAVSSG